MMDALLPLSHWTWWIAGVVLVVLEVVLPGTFLLWMGVSAAVVGVIVYFAPGLPVAFQFTLFAVLALVAVFLSRRYLQKNRTAEQTALSARGAHYIGRVVTVEDALTGGVGKVRVEDTVWRARGADAAAGARVKITGISGATFQVEPVHEPEHSGGEQTEHRRATAE